MILTEKIGDMNIWEFILALFIVQIIVALLIAGVQALINKH
jgi:hypothetical protein